MNVGGVFMLAFIGSLAQSAAAQAAFAVSYSQLFSLITWTSTGLMGAAAAAAGQNLGAGKPDRADEAVHVAARIGVMGAAFIGLFFLFFPAQLLAVFGMNEAVVVQIGSQLLRVLSLSGLFIAVALTYTGGLQGTGDTKSPLYISIVSQIIVPLGICFVIKQHRDIAAASHLDRDPHRPRDPLRAEHRPLQSGEVAQHLGGHRRALALLSGGRRRRRRRLAHESGDERLGDAVVEALVAAHRAPPGSRRTSSPWSDTSCSSACWLPVHAAVVAQQAPADVALR